MTTIAFLFTTAMMVYSYLDKMYKLSLFTALLSGFNLCTMYYMYMGMLHAP